MSHHVEPLFGIIAFSTVLLIIAGVLGLVGLLALYLAFFPGPRRRRGLKRVRRRLQEGAWHEAQDRLKKLRLIGVPSPVWRARFDQVEADCLRLAMQEALKEKKFEEGLAFGAKVAELSNEPVLDTKLAVQNAMLEELRRLFGQSLPGDSKDVHDLVTRILLVHTPCREASFWQGLAFLRGGQPERALESLQVARTGAMRSLTLEEDLPALNPNSPPPPSTSFIDPPLYLGALLLRQGRTKDALRFFTEANRIDGSCPVVTLLLGTALVQTGGDAQFAVRALQRALGPKGLQMWQGQPQRLWVEAFPEHRSYIRKLASQHPYVCPIYGGDLHFLIRQGHLALAQGLYRLGTYQESADLFLKVLQEGAPSLGVVRGLGLALARIGQYDEAFKHLRAAHEMEEPKERTTAGYLALCGAKGKPTHAEDKTRNVLWAVRTLLPFTAPGDAEWVALISAVHAEARDTEVPLDADDQLYLCEHLVSVHAADPPAAQAYHHLMATFPQAVRAEYAWLFCQAAAQHGVGGTHALELFARTFSEPQPAREFFTRQGWDFEAVELAFLQCAAEQAPGHYPAVLGSDYGPRGEKLLLDWSCQEEACGQPLDALAAAEVLVKLDPSNPHGLDRLAVLHHRQGSGERVLEILAAWHEAHPHDPAPWVRRAMLLVRHGDWAEAERLLGRALDTAHGPQKARIAFLAGRLVLKHLLTGKNGVPATAASSEGAPAVESLPPALPAGIDMPENKGLLSRAEEYLRLCLDLDPQHADAAWCLAAVSWLRGDGAALVRLAPTMVRPELQHPRFHLLAALCHLAAQDYPAAVAACRRVAMENLEASAPTAGQNGQLAAPLATGLGIEAAYLEGLAQLHMDSMDEAQSALQAPAQAGASASAGRAQALLGGIAFARGRFEDAIGWWQKLDQKQRAAWKLGETLGNTIFLTALKAYQEENYEAAAEKLRAAGRLGCRDRRLGALLVQALFRAGQQLVC